MKKIIIAITALLSSFGANLAALPAQVILIRHAETTPAGELSQKGYERAGALAAYFALTPALTAFGPPKVIFATRPSPVTPPYLPGDNTQRCLETVGPTALFLHLPIHCGYDSLQEAALASLILNDSKYSGKTVLICWQQATIGSLAQALGIASPPAYPVGQYDITWVITYSPSPSLAVYNQQLLYGDAL